MSSGARLIRNISWFRVQRAVFLSKHCSGEASCLGNKSRGCSLSCFQEESVVCDGRGGCWKGELQRAVLTPEKNTLTPLVVIAQGKPTCWWRRPAPVP